MTIINCYKEGKLALQFLVTDDINTASVLLEHLSSLYERIEMLKGDLYEFNSDPGKSESCAYGA